MRATLNGQLISVPETLYNDFIFREIEAEGEEFQEAHILSDLLTGPLKSACPFIL
ncbi:DUF3658 domain-containing protein [Desulfosporosinus sp. FKB]|uniref:DUF3658 domain-containing protein n=1 Tax=Desulfosporosinus sp. FKB TaxID=1969835 RepID=UPI001FA8525D|nr:DUF3658 domain-containing protein [Desulfosporosinus sp. FKB]